MKNTRRGGGILRAAAAAAALSVFLAGCGNRPNGPDAASSAQGAAANQGPRTAQGAVAGSGAGRTPGAGSGAPQGRQGQASPRISAITVPVVTAKYGPLTAMRSVAGSVQPVTQSQVAAQVGGVVQKTLHKVGDWVSAGETVIQLDDTQLRFTLRNAQGALENARINLSVGQDTSSQASPKLVMQLQSAQSALDAAQKNFDSQKALYDLGGVTAAAVDSAASQVQQAQAAVEAAKTALDQNQKADTQNIAQLKLALDTAQTGVDQAQFNLKNAAIKAPFAGQISALSVAPGMYLNSNSTAFVLVSAGRQITFNASPSDAPNLQSGSTVQFTFRGKSYPVRINQTPAAPVNGIVSMSAAFPGGASLAFGSVGTVSYELNLAQGVIVPVAAIQTNEDKNYLFIVEGGKVALKWVTILGETGIAVAVSGIDSGAQAIVNPPPGLIQGSEVNAVEDQSGQAPGEQASTGQGSGSGGRQGGFAPGGAAQGAGRASGSAGQGGSAQGASVRGGSR